MSSTPARPNGHNRSSSRASSNSAQGNQHRPTLPSGLRQAHRPPLTPDARAGPSESDGTTDYFDGNGIRPVADDASVRSDASVTHNEGTIQEPEPNAKTKLLSEAKRWSIPVNHTCENENCDHGTMSPRPRYHRGDYGSFAPSVASTADGYGGGGSGGDRSLGQALADAFGARREGDGLSNTQHVARKNGIKTSKLMYVGETRARRNADPIHLQHLQANTEVGTCFTTFHLPTGYGNTAGPFSRAIWSLP